MVTAGTRVDKYLLCLWSFLELVSQELSNWGSCAPCFTDEQSEAQGRKLGCQDYRARATKVLFHASLQARIAAGMSLRGGVIQAFACVRVPVTHGGGVCVWWWGEWLSPAGMDPSQDPHTAARLPTNQAAPWMTIRNPGALGQGMWWVCVWGRDSWAGASTYVIGIHQYNVLVRWCDGLNCGALNPPAPLKKYSYIEILTHRTSECDLIWRQGLYRDHHVKVSSSGWALIQQHRCP